MIDIHTHILPGVDDGSPDMFDSILLAETAVESGVHTIIATPHSHSDRSGREQLAAIRQAFDALKREIAERGLPLELLPGMEILCREDLEDRFREGTVLPLNGTNRYLIEFAFEEQPERIRRYIGIVQSRGGQAVIAHPERYVCLQRKLSLAEEWLRLGCQLQLNKDSVFGAFGRITQRTAKKLLKRGMYAYAASDAHSPYRRTTQLDGLYDYLRTTYSPETAETLLLRSAETFLLRRS